MVGSLLLVLVYELHTVESKNLGSKEEMRHDTKDLAQNQNRYTINISS